MSLSECARSCVFSLRYSKLCRSLILLHRSQHYPHPLDPFPGAACAPRHSALFHFPFYLFNNHPAVACWVPSWTLELPAGWPGSLQTWLGGLPAHSLSCLLAKRPSLQLPPATATVILLSLQQRLFQPLALWCLVTAATGN